MGGGEDRCLDEGQVFDELSRAINGKEKDLDGEKKTIVDLDP